MIIHFCHNFPSVMTLIKASGTQDPLEAPQIDIGTRTRGGVGHESAVGVVDLEIEVNVVNHVIKRSGTLRKIVAGCLL